MDRILRGPSPMKDTPRRGFKEVVLGPPQPAGSPPSPPLRPLVRRPVMRLEQPPPPASALLPVRSFEFCSPPVNIGDSPFPDLPTDQNGSLAISRPAQDLNYGRLSPPPGKGTPASRVEPAGGVVAVSGPELAVGPASSRAGTGPAMLGRVGVLAPVRHGCANMLLPPPPDNRLHYNHPTGPVSQPGPVARHVKPEPTGGMAQELAAVPNTGGPSFTQRLSLECQLRRFNPKWDEQEIGPGVFKCEVFCKEIRITNGRTFSTKEGAKQAIARTAYRMVRTWPLAVGPYHSSRKPATDQVRAGKTAHPRQGREAPAAAAANPCPSSLPHASVTYDAMT